MSAFDDTTVLKEIYVLQKGESASQTASLIAPNILRFVAAYHKRDEAIAFARQALDVVYNQLLVNGNHKINEKEIHGDLTIGLVNYKTETTISFYAVQKVVIQ